jgi:hypothetical protein
MANSEWVGYAAEKDRRIVNPGTSVGDIAESKCAAVSDCFLEEDSLLLSLTGYGGLEGTEDLIGLGDRELGDGYICTCSIFDCNRRAMFAVAEEGGAGGREIESHVLVGAFGDF